MPKKPVLPSSTPSSDLAPRAPGTGGCGANPAFTFATFVVGSSNRFAHEAAWGLATGAPEAGRALYLWGANGLGKTHLLRAIGNHLAASRPGLRVALVAAHGFLEELVAAIGDRDMLGFQRRYRGLDALLLDDLPYLAGKERSQEELVHTLDALSRTGRVMAFTGDDPPGRVPGLSARLRARLEGALAVEIEPPDLDLKRAVLDRKAQDAQVVLPPDVAEHLVTRCSSNLRELEGALVRLAAASRYLAVPLDLDLARRLFDGQGPGPAPRGAAPD
ncbi:MAG: DnaA/Hda family protein [Deferrisomatales bacterium]